MEHGETQGHSQSDCPRPALIRPPIQSGDLLDGQTDEGSERVDGHRRESVPLVHSLAGLGILASGSDGISAGLAEDAGGAPQVYGP